MSLDLFIRVSVLQEVRPERALETVLVSVAFRLPLQERGEQAPQLRVRDRRNLGFLGRIDSYWDRLGVDGRRPVIVLGKGLVGSSEPKPDGDVRPVANQPAADENARDQSEHHGDCRYLDEMPAYG